MTRRLSGNQRLTTLGACSFILIWPVAAADNGTTTDSLEPAPTSSEIRELKRMLADQQRQIDELRRELVVQQKNANNKPVLVSPPDTPTFAQQGIGEVASLTAVVPVTATTQSTGSDFLNPAPLALAQVPASQAGGTALDSLSKKVDDIEKRMSIGGFRFSGDLRYRLDMQLRSANSTIGALQNVRGRYRVRLNVDKDIVSGLTSHVQLSTGPYSNETTFDQDFAGFAVRQPFSIVEAWMRYQNKNFTIRGGRTEEVFADNGRFMWDDDVRLNGFDARYKAGPVEFRVGEYILSNPNTLIVAAGSPYLAAGYQLGQKVRDSTLFHPGFIFKSKPIGGWTHQLYGDFLWYRNANQIQLASTAAGTPVLVNNAVGITLQGTIGQTGNATTTAGGAILSARHWQIPRGGYRLDHSDLKLGKQSMPFWVDLQGSVNTGTGSDRTAFMATVNLGATRKLGDLMFRYQYSRKEANSLISQFTDDDLGTQTGVNTTVNAIRVDVGLTRFLSWQNLVFLQDPIAGNRPGFFVTVPKGANTTYRYLGQLAFAF